ncbi:VWA domain-containing protein, partial [Candidatus Uhrbacteria bacterium]|nr:VWA domain-containing protein [Candidatus Uhrbacteria bacterium]
METTVRMDRSKVNHKDPGAVHAMVSITAPEVTAADRKPIDVVVAIDVSSSMTEPATTAHDGASKLELAKQAVRRFIENLAPGDRVGIVTYSTDVDVLAPLRELTEDYRREVTAKVGALAPVSATDLVGGALRALGLLKECAADVGRTRRVLLFTDGLPTHGITKYADVVRAITAQLDGKTPISTFGFGAAVVANGVGGGGYDPELLLAIAKG